MSKTSASRIKVVCPCGKKYSVRSDLAGKKIKCRSCNEILRIEATPKNQDATSNPWQCSKCSAEMVAGLSDCLVCGHDFAPTKHQSRDQNQHDHESANHLEIGQNTFSGDMPVRKKRPRRRTRSGFTASTTGLGSPSVIYAIIAGLSVLALALLQTQLRGETFLIMYFLFGVACLIGGFAAEANSCHKYVAIFISIASFELLGAIRLAYGISHGMHKFRHLHSMMIFFPIAIIFYFGRYFTAMGDEDNKYGRSSWGGCGGGGGGGGGGCGGCGG